MAFIAKNSMTTRAYGFFLLSGAPALLLGCAQKMPVNGFGRRAALILRKIVRLCGNRVIDAEVDGIKMRFYTEDNVSERKFLFMPQFYDVQERALIAAQLPADGIFVDIGANAGIYSLWAAKQLSANGRVISVEPNPVVLERLKFNTAVNNFEDRITAVQAAVSDCEGVFDLTLDATNLGGSSLIEGAGEKISVPCKALLSLLREQGVEKIDMLKIDIEGAEDRALIPFFHEAQPALYPRFIITENSEKKWQEDLSGLLAVKGYSKILSTRMNLVFKRQSS